MDRAFGELIRNASKVPTPTAPTVAMQLGGPSPVPHPASCLFAPTSRPT